MVSLGDPSLLSITAHPEMMSLQNSGLRSASQVQGMFSEREITDRVFDTPTVPLLFASWKTLVDALFLVSFSQSSQRKNFYLYQSFSEWGRPITSGCGDSQYIVNHLNTPAVPSLPVFPSLHIFTSLTWRLLIQAPQGHQRKLSGSATSVLTKMLTLELEEVVFIQSYIAHTRVHTHTPSV